VRGTERRQPPRHATGARLAWLTIFALVTLGATPDRITAHKPV
jgi:hypothetical protein